MPPSESGRPPAAGQAPAARLGESSSPAPASSPTPSTPRYWLYLPCFGTAYFLAAWLGHALSPPSQSFVPFWLPGGLYLAALLLSPTRAWPAIVLAAIAGNATFDLTNGQPLAVVGLFSLANSAEALAAAWLVRRFVIVRPAFESPNEALRFVAFAVVLAPMIGATIGATTVVGLLSGTSFASTWLMWWSGDATGMLLFAPPLLGLASQKLRDFGKAPPLRYVELLAILAGVGLIGWFAIDLELRHGLGLKYLTIPLIGLAIVRFGLRGGSLSLLIVGLAYARHTAQIEVADATATVSPVARTISLQLFLAVLGTTALAFSALLTERRQRERLLRESAALQKRVFESSVMPLVVMDAETFRYIDCNPAAVAIYRHASKAEVLGKSPMDFSATVQHDGALSAEKARHYINHALAEGSVVFEWLHRRPDGELWDAEVHLMSFTSGERRFLQFTLQDITQRRRAAAALQHHQNMLARTEHLAQVGSWEWDSATDTVRWSAELFRLFQRNPAEGAPSFAEHAKLYLPEDLKRLQAAVTATLSQGTPYELELRGLRGDGMLRVFLASGHSEQGPGRPALRLFGALQDITERMQTIEALKESEAKFATAFRASPVPMAIRDLGTDRYVDVNDRCLALMGYTRAEVVGRAPMEIGWMAPEDRERNRIALSTDGGVTDRELHLRRKDGTEVICSFNTHTIQIGGRPCVLSTTIDITERRRTETQLCQKMAELQASNHELTRFNRVATDRELRMIELKQEINDLCHRAGQPPRYPLSFIETHSTPARAEPPLPA